MQQLTTNETPKDRPFNPHREPKSQAAIDTIENVTGQLLTYEGYKKTRQRQRNAKDMESFKKIVSAIICDLVHNQLTSPEKLVYISLSKRILGKSGRYNSPIHSKVLPNILETLSAPEMAYVSMEKGYRGFDDSSNRRTTITCGPRLLSLISAQQLSLHDLTQSLSQETIILKAPKESYFDKGEWSDYADSNLTKSYRTQLYSINSWLAEAEIHCDDDVDISNRLLRRHFANNSFESGGRLFGGFWQHMSKVQRKSNIVIDEESVITLDFSQAAPRIAYGLVGAQPPIGDAYTLPCGKYNRKDIKKIFNAMIYAEEPLKRFPKGTREAFERSTSFTHVQESILNHHQPISDLFGKGIGMQLMFIESQILISALLECQSRGIVALPVHDALIVPFSRKAEVRGIMLDSFMRIAHIEGSVEEE